MNCKLIKINKIKNIKVRLQLIHRNKIDLCLTSNLIVFLIRRKYSRIINF